MELSSGVMQIQHTATQNVYLWLLWYGDNCYV